MVDDGTGTYKVTENYLKTFASTNLQQFIDDYENNHAVRMLRGYAGEASYSEPGRDRIYAGSPNGVKSADQLSSRFAQFSETLRQQLVKFSDGFVTLQRGLNNVDLTLKDGEDSASDISKGSFDAATAPALGRLGGTAPGGTGSAPSGTGSASSGGATA
ncbi:hypothetical protein AB0J38_30680 [Streptomyces sp. NPDC050095]|uniref:hypothetical protein n=1 Tax=unclassified Streptomyces TaxID=2593676 RepID=UPI00344AF689